MKMPSVFGVKDRDRTKEALAELLGYSIETRFDLELFKGLILNGERDHQSTV